MVINVDQFGQQKNNRKKKRKFCILMVEVSGTKYQYRSDKDK